MFVNGCVLGIEQHNQWYRAKNLLPLWSWLRSLDAWRCSPSSTSPLLLACRTGSANRPQQRQLVFCSQLPADRTVNSCGFRWNLYETVRTQLFFRLAVRGSRCVWERAMLVPSWKWSFMIVLRNSYRKSFGYFSSNTMLCRKDPCTLSVVLTPAALQLGFSRHGDWLTFSEAFS